MLHITEVRQSSGGKWVGVPHQCPSLHKSGCWVSRDLFPHVCSCYAPAPQLILASLEKKLEWPPHIKIWWCLASDMALLSLGLDSQALTAPRESDLIGGHRREVFSDQFLPGPLSTMGCQYRHGQISYPDDWSFLYPHM